MAKTRIYTVASKDGQTKRLVRASRQGPAMAHVAASLFTVHQATQNELEELIGKVPVEDVTADPGTGANAGA